MSREADADSEPRPVLRNFSDLAAKLLVSGGLLYWLLSGFDLATFGSILKHTHIGLFVLAWRPPAHSALCRSLSPAHRRFAGTQRGPCHRSQIHADVARVVVVIVIVRVGRSSPPSRGVAARLLHTTTSVAPPRRLQ